MQKLVALGLVGMLAACSGGGTSPVPIPPVSTPQLGPNAQTVDAGTYCVNINTVPSVGVSPVFTVGGGASDPQTFVAKTSGIITITPEQGGWGVAGTAVGTTDAWLIDQAKNSVLMIYHFNVESSCPR